MLNMSHEEFISKYGDSDDPIIKEAVERMQQLVDMVQAVKDMVEYE